MDKSNPPTNFGVFKPVGHTLMAFATPDKLRNAQRTLGGLGFGANALVEYSAAEMLQLADEQLQAVGLMANFGYELDLLRANRLLAEGGCCFLVVQAEDDKVAAQVANLVATLQPVAAQHYGRFLIQNLTERSPVASR
jgi:hypothetical protein